MTREPLLTLRALQPLVSGLIALGHDPAALLNAIGIDRGAFADPDARVPMRVGVDLFARAVDETGDQNLGLHLAQAADLSSVDVLFYAMASSPSLGAAYERLCRYQRLINDTTVVELSVRNDRATLRHRLPGGAAAPRQSAEFIVAGWVRAGRVITGVDWTPSLVRFAHAAPPDPSEHRAFFRAPVVFAAGENTLELDAALLDLRCVHSDPALVAVLDRHASDRLEKVPPTATLASRVRAVVEEEFRGGEPTAQRCAARLKMSVRTLNRQLAAEATSFRAILDQLRYERATAYLVARDIAIAEVAFLLGFSDVSAFHRAFKRWSGATPAEFRDRSRPADRP